MSTKLGSPIFLTMGLDEALAKLHTILGSEGFTVVNSLDVRKVMKDKFSMDFRPFMSIGVYHADVLKRVLHEKPEATLWLPWSISLETIEGRTRLMFPDPMEMTRFVSDDATWRQIASDLKTRFERVVTSFSDVTVK